MIQFITQTPNYQISVDSHKNRLYLKIIGFWRNKEQVAGYLPDLANALHNLQPAFTLLTDLTEMKTHPVDLQSVHLQAQQLLLSKGLKQTAEVYHSSMVQFQTGTYSQQSKMPLRQFNSQHEAENYLDSVATS